jgi:hypothetical protein
VSWLKELKGKISRGENVGRLVGRVMIVITRRALLTILFGPMVAVLSEVATLAAVEEEELAACRVHTAYVWCGKSGWAAQVVAGEKACKPVGLVDAGVVAVVPLGDLAHFVGSVLKCTHHLVAAGAHSTLAGPTFPGFAGAGGPRCS